MPIWFTRFLLIAALVFSQALYAGHSLYHTNGDKVDCQICLQASSGSSAIANSVVAPQVSLQHDTPVRPYSLPVVPSPFSNHHPARAPPSLPV